MQFGHSTLRVYVARAEFEMQSYLMARTAATLHSQSSTAQNAAFKKNRFCEDLLQHSPLQVDANPEDIQALL